MSLAGTVGPSSPLAIGCQDDTRGSCVLLIAPGSPQASVRLLLAEWATCQRADVAVYHPGMFSSVAGKDSQDTANTACIASSGKRDQLPRCVAERLLLRAADAASSSAAFCRRSVRLWGCGRRQPRALGRRRHIRHDTASRCRRCWLRSWRLHGRHLRSTMRRCISFAVRARAPCIPAASPPVSGAGPTY